MDAVKCAQNTMARFSRIRYNHCDDCRPLLNMQRPSSRRRQTEKNRCIYCTHKPRRRSPRRGHLLFRADSKIDASETVAAAFNYEV